MVSITSVEDDRSLEDKQDQVYEPSTVPTRIYTGVPVNTKDTSNTPRSLSERAAEKDRKLRANLKKSNKSGAFKGFMNQDVDDDISLTNIANRMTTMENTVNDLKPLKNLIGMEDSVRELIGDLKGMLEHAAKGRKLEEFYAGPSDESDQGINKRSNKNKKQTQNSFKGSSSNESDSSRNSRSSRYSFASFRGKKVKIKCSSLGKPHTPKRYDVDEEDKDPDTGIHLDPNEYSNRKDSLRDRKKKNSSSKDDDHKKHKRLSRRKSMADKMSSKYYYSATGSSRYEGNPDPSEPTIPRTKYKRKSNPVNTKNDYSERRNHKSVSMHVQRDSELDGLVAWSHETIEGPYGGRVDKFLKCGSRVKLEDDESHSFFKYYHGLCTHLALNAFSIDLLPKLVEIHAQIDLTRPPMLLEYLDPVGAQEYVLTKEMLLNQHQRLAEALYAILDDTIKSTCTIGYASTQRNFSTSDRFRVLMDILERHHPRLANSTAKDYDDVESLVPSYSSCQHSLDVYMSSYSQWTEVMDLYPESVQFKPSHVSQKFIGGFPKNMIDILMPELNEILIHKRDFKDYAEEHPLPPNLCVETLYAKLRHILGPQPLPTSTSRALTYRISNIDTQPEVIESDIAVKDYIPADGNWDVSLLEQVDSAPFAYASVLNISGGGGRTYSSQRLEKPVSCPWDPCGKVHPPNIFCICGAENHTVSCCWHIVPPPEDIQRRITGFKAMYANLEGPFQPKTALDKKVCYLALPSSTTSPSTPTPNQVSFVTDNSATGQDVSSLSEFIKDAKEDIHDQSAANQRDMDAYLNHMVQQHTKSVCNLGLDVLLSNMLSSMPNDSHIDSGTDSMEAHMDALRETIQELEPDSYPWINEKCVQLTIPSIYPGRVLGMEYEYDYEMGRCRGSRLVNDTPAARYLTRGNTIGNYILMINGQSVRTPDEVEGAVNMYIELSHQYHERLATGLRPRSADGYAAALQGLSLLLCKKNRKATDMIDDLDLNKSDLAMSRMVWAIGMIGNVACQKKKNTELITHDSNYGLEISHVEGMDIIPEDYVQDFFQVGIASISNMNDSSKKCPVNWKMAMQNHDDGLRREALYSHLVKCYNMGTYGIPQVAPPGARVIPPVRALKLLRNTLKQIDERKVRVCVNGSQQTQGIDFQESFAAALLGMTFNLFIALACWFSMDVYHLDISNCFQCTPDESEEKLWNGTYLSRMD